MKRKFLLLAALVVAAIVVLVMVGNKFYLDLLWFTGAGYEGVFWTRYLTYWGLRLFTWLFFFVFLFVNLMLTHKTVLYLPNLNIREQMISSGYYKFITSRRITFIFLGLSAFISFIFSAYTGGFWMELQQFLHSTSFGVADPIFNTDISFYVFELPFYRFIYQYLMMVLIVTLVLVGIIHLTFNPPAQVERRWFFFSFPGLGQISLLFSLIFLLKAGDYWMQMRELVLSGRGYAFGAGYTDINVSLPVFWVLLSLALVLAVVFVINIKLKRADFVIYGLGSIIAVSLVGGVIIPGLVESLRVSPAQLTYEAPYIEHHIDYTRRAYGLDNFETVQYSAEEEITWSDYEENKGTFNNIRLWDYRPIHDTFRQVQEMREFYNFYDVDIDRYYVDGEYRQVMLSAREIDHDGLAPDARTWVNQHLQYTHGYGLAASPVNEATPDGMPRYFLKDIPPEGVEEMHLDKPEIYYGEKTDSYVISNTKTREFNYPQEGENVYTHYDGEGGVQLNSLARRLLFALRFGEYRILLSGEIQPESRIMFNRRIQDRIEKVAPFLELDKDPYIVINEGRLYWIQDAYTTTDRHPYSRNVSDMNYIRNSVKVVVDAYHGSMDFYVVDQEDPLIQTYSKIFPGMFSSIEEIPEGLEEHLRYPVDLFNVQADLYRLYHMTSPAGFYNRHALWDFPREEYRGDKVYMEPYYTIMQLPGEQEEEFALIYPFTLEGREEMIAWMAARSDYENYGEVKVYQFPAGRHVFGPEQVERRIDQCDDISREFALWGREGSRVIRGNLLVLPVNRGILYMEPIFLEAEAKGREEDSMPQLRRFIVATGENVVMEETVKEGLQQVLVEREEITRLPEEIPGEEVEEIEDIEALKDYFVPAELSDLAQELEDTFREARQKQQEGDWSGYGEKLMELEELLQELKEEVDAEE